jgi:hypothetical protein
LAPARAFYGETKGASAVVKALNVAYEEKESRGIVKLYFLAFAFRQDWCMRTVYGKAGGERTGRFWAPEWRKRTLVQLDHDGSYTPQ